MAGRVRDRSSSSYGFRNIGGFHEDCTVTIGERSSLLKPKWLRIGGYWYPARRMPSTCSGRAGSSRRRLGAGPGRGTYRGRG
jgi:7-cyano-7-deazaguanine reductase